MTEGDPERADALVVFLKARLNEDKAKATAAIRRKAGFVEHWAEFDGDGGAFLGPFGTFLPPQYQVSECDTPEHTLRDIEAKQEIVHAYEDWLTIRDQVTVRGRSGWSKDSYAQGHGEGLRYAVCRLAATYAHHRDYDEEWGSCY